MTEEERKKKWLKGRGRIGKGRMKGRKGKSEGEIGRKDRDE